MESYYNQTGKTIAVFGTIKETGGTLSIVSHSQKSGIEDLKEVAVVDREYFDHLVRSRKTMDML